MKHVVFSDFDGTITAKDTLDTIYDTFGPVDWRDRQSAMWKAGKRSRDIIAYILSLCECTREQIVELLRTIPVRDGFVEFRNFCRDNRFELVIMSEGIGVSVQTVLHERGIDDLPYFGNILDRDGDGRWTTRNPHRIEECPDCGNCKCAHLIERKKRGEAVVYIGDGVTDWCPAHIADIVFARGSLARYCDRHGIPYKPFETFLDVLAEFRRSDFVARLEHLATQGLEHKLHLPARNEAVAGKLASSDPNEGEKSDRLSH